MTDPKKKKFDLNMCFLIRLFLELIYNILNILSLYMYV